MTEQSALELRPDGTIGIDMGTCIVSLRRPTLGEFKRWRIQLTEMAKELQKKQEANGEPGAGEDEAEDRSIQFWSDVFATLAAGSVPDPDDWPPFLIYGDQVLGQVLTHWRTVPLGPGTNSNRPTKKQPVA